MFPVAERPFVPPQFGIKLASEGWEHAASAALRRSVFCEEQRIFAHDDHDAIDAVADTIVAVDYCMGMSHRVVGTVRIHRADDGGTWFGSRLALDRAHRGVYGLGRGLVHRAVTTAHARGGTRFLAHVQLANVGFFRRLAWTVLGDELVYGRPHALMEADLRAYPPEPDDAAVAIFAVRRAS